ncbi:hypothetical protein BGW42_008141 [Actinomortierella wolfii]|nr:hypothetical protein BGW42_008141 [Actinomortierella wolfii]
MATINSEIQALGQSFQEVRALKGHWDGADPNPDIDNFNGKKHEHMKKLGDYFGKAGTSAADLLATMGQPDEIKTSMDEAFQASLMPGPAIGGGGIDRSGGQQSSFGNQDVDATVMPENSGQPQQVMYFIYKWRGNHDYLWFKVDAAKETVIESSWYHAYE